MYKKIDKCRSCNDKTLTNIVDLGKQPLANALLKKRDFTHETKVPLELIICNKCKLVQLKHTVDPKKLFKKYLWVTGTSKKVKSYRKFFFKKINEKLKLEKKFICEIASNDGFFLDYVKKNNEVIGIDPAKNIAKIASQKGIKTYTDFFNSKTADKIIKKHQKKPDLILCRNVIPHIENIQSVMKGLNRLISEDGLGAIEFHNATNLIMNKHYDYIYHEHIFYFTLTSIYNVLKKNNLHAFDFFKSPISGGSYVILFKRKKISKTKKFQTLFNKERILKINSVKNWKKLKEICQSHKKKFNSILKKIEKSNKISAYGASARSSTLINYLNLKNDLIDVVFDINGLKTNLYTPGTQIKILKPSFKILKKYKVVILLAWNFKDEIIQYLKKMKFKGEIIMPLPKIKRIQIN